MGFRTITSVTLQHFAYSTIFELALLMIGLKITEDVSESNCFTHYLDKRPRKKKQNSQSYITENL